MGPFIQRRSKIKPVLPVIIFLAVVYNPAKVLIMSNIEIFNNAIGNHPILSGFTVAVLAGATLALFKKYVINRNSPGKITIEGEQLIKDLFEAKKVKELPFTIDDYKKLNDRLKKLEKELSEEKNETRKAEIKLAESALIIGRDAAKMALEGKIEEAKERFLQAINTFPDVEVLNLYGIFLMGIGEMDNAVTKFEAVINIGESSNNKETLAAGYNNLGLIYKTRGDLDKAEEFHKKALDIYKALGHREGIASQYGNLGIIYQTRGDLDKAEEFHKKALKLNEKLGRKEGMANQYGNLGIIYQTRGDLDKAEEFFKKVLIIED